MPIEVWRDIVGYEGFYQVSSLGRVRSLPRVVLDARLGLKSLKGKVLSLPTDSSGYVIVVLQKNGSKKSCKVHRLVAKHFIEEVEGKDCVNHLDHDRANNCCDNLEWCTHQENTEHMHNADRNYSAFGFENASTKLSEDDVREIRKLSKTESHKKVAEMFCVSSQHIDKIINGQRRSEVV